MLFEDLIELAFERGEAKGGGTRKWNWRLGTGRGGQ